MYSVGQILFVVLNKKPQIIPVKVIEQVVRRSLDGENIQYSVQVPTAEGDKTFELDELDAEVYTSISDVENAMFENARNMIKHMSEKATRVATSKFEYSPSLPKQPSTETQDGSISIPDTPPSAQVSSQKVQLDDGTVVNLHLPDGIK